MESEPAPEISLVIPAYNESGRLPRFLTSALQWLDGDGRRYEVLVVDDGSQDGTDAAAHGAAANNQHVRVIRHERNQGKGAAVRTGMLAARGAIRLFADADGATAMEELPSLRDALQGDVQVAVGSREGGKVVRVSGLRKFLGRWFNRAVRAGIIKGIRDTQCGFKLFTAAAARRLFTLAREDGYAFDVEVLFLARKLGLGIAEVPVNWTEIAGSKVRLLRDGMRMLRAVRRIKRRWLGGGYAEKPPTETA